MHALPADPPFLLQPPSAATPQSETTRAGPVLTLLRHGQSRWNRSWRFTGWEDVALSARGRLDARRAGRMLLARDRPVDVCFTSMLGRAMHTAEIALAERGQADLPIHPCWRLNERHYGALQGLTPWTAAMRYGPLRVLRCRHRRRERPPSLSPTDSRSPLRDSRYARVDPLLLPHTESLRDVAARVMPCWHERIAPELARHRHVLVVSHRNLLQVLLALLGEQPRGLGCGQPQVIRFAHDDARLREAFADTTTAGGRRDT